MRARTRARERARARERERKRDSESKSRREPEQEQDREREGGRARARLRKRESETSKKAEEASSSMSANELLRACSRGAEAESLKAERAALLSFKASSASSDFSEDFAPVPPAAGVKNKGAAGFVGSTVVLNGVVVGVLVESGGWEGENAREREAERNVRATAFCSRRALC